MQVNNPPAERCPIHGEFTADDGHFVLYLKRKAGSLRPAEHRRFCGECYLEFIARNIPELVPLNADALPPEPVPLNPCLRPALFYWLSLGSWSMSSGRLFILIRIYWRGRWTPFVKMVQRY